MSLPAEVPLGFWFRPSIAVLCGRIMGPVPDADHAALGDDLSVAGWASSARVRHGELATTVDSGEHHRRFFCALALVRAWASVRAASRSVIAGMSRPSRKASRMTFRSASL